MSAPSPVTAETRVVNRAGLAAALRRAWDDPGAEPLDHTVELVPGSSPARGGVYRLRGTARTGAEVRPWRLVLKVLRPLDPELLARVRVGIPAELDALAEAIRWDREALVYRSGLLDDLPPGLVAPRCHAVEARPGDGIWLWLEDVGDDRGRWTIEDFARAAHQVGRFNGVYLAGRPLPTEPWLSRDACWTYLRFLAAEGWAVVSDPAKWRSPLARAVFPAPPIERLARLWADLDLFQAALRRLPRTFCHHDAHEDNLFFRPDGLAAIDWQMSGFGAVGEEIAQLVAYCLKKSYTVPGARAAELDHAVFAGYAAGLRTAGWTGDERLARLGYLAALVPAHAMQVSQLNLLGDATRHPAAERHLGMPMLEIAHHHAAVTHHLLDLADEARRLIVELNR